MAPALAALNARIFTLALPRIPAMSASVPGRFSQETVSCFTFGMRGTSRREKWHDATRGGRSGQFPNRRKSWCGRWDSNPHALRRHPLKMVRLPVPPLPHWEGYQRILAASGNLGKSKLKCRRRPRVRAEKRRWSGRARPKATAWPAAALEAAASEAGPEVSAALAAAAQDFAAVAPASAAASVFPGPSVQVWRTARAPSRPLARQPFGAGPALSK